MSNFLNFASRIASNSPWIQNAVKRFGLITLANRLLRYANIIRTVPGTSLRYRIQFCDTPVLADGIFKHGEYKMLSGDIASIRSFIDLGCNVGLFPLYLCFAGGRNDFYGIMVDGNPKVVAEARENLRLNQLHETISVIHGLAVADDGSSEAEFCVTQNSLSSTAHADLLTNTFGATRIVAPVVNVLKEFRNAHPEAQRIDLLKLDIEGCELEFLATHRDLVALTDRIILEFHKCMVSFDQVRDLLVPQGFRVVDCFDDAGLPWGIAYFTR